MITRDDGLILLSINRVLVKVLDVLDMKFISLTDAITMTGKEKNNLDACSSMQYSDANICIWESYISIF